MLRFVVLFTTAMVVYSCSPKSKSIQEFNEEGVLMKEYTMNKDSALHGTLISYFDDGVTTFEKANYVNGALDGVRNIYFESGQIEISEQYKDNVLVDTLRVFYPSGKIKRKEYYNDGVLTGTLKSYYESGGIKEEVSFRNNLENGPFKEYFENGQIKWSGNYLEGDNEVGELQRFDSTGTLIRKLMCDDLSVCRTIWTLEEEITSD